MYWHGRNKIKNIKKGIKNNMEWIAGLVILLPIVYFVMMIAHYVVLKLIVFMKWDETDWFHDMVEEETK